MKSDFSFFCPISDRPNLPLLIFLPGMHGTGRLFYKQVEGLQPFFNLRCLTIPTDDLSDWNTLTTKVISLIKTEGKKQHNPDIYLCGESFGACLALSVSTKMPSLFKYLVLVNPASSFAKYPWLSWGIPMIKWVPNYFYPYSNVALLPFLAALERITQPDRQNLLAAIKSVSVETVSWRLYLLQHFAVSPEQLKRFTSPVLLIASGSDRLLPSVEEALYLKNQLPDAKLLVLPKSGHACLMEKDVHLYQLLQTHLDLEKKENKVLA